VDARVHEPEGLSSFWTDHNDFMMGFAVISFYLSRLPTWWWEDHGVFFCFSTHGITSRHSISIITT
jgi:hypothetical protein